MKVDFRKMLAAVSQREVATMQFFGKKKDVEISFLSVDGTVHKRSIRVYLPSSENIPLPLVFTAHYEMHETDVLLQLYLERGWAVSTPLNVPSMINEELVDDDMVFNNAALYEIMRMPEIDRNRVIVSGGSAGGYMTAMLSILRMGICGAVCFSGILNSEFDFRYYFPETQQYNEEVKAQLSTEQLKNMVTVLESVPIPFGDVAFSSILPFVTDSLNQRENAAEAWRRFSPVNMTACFSNPILFTHFTSDILLPVDQLTRNFTYKKVSGTLPENFKHRLNDFPLSGESGYSIAEVLPDEDVSEVCLPVAPEENDVLKISFDVSKRFNIIVFDDGPIEENCGHQKNIIAGTVDATSYMDVMMQQSASKNNWLTSEKLAFLAEQYSGRSIVLPGYQEREDVYGSLKMDQKIVVDELKYFARKHPDDWMSIFQRTAAMRPDLKIYLKEIWDRII